MLPLAPMSPVRTSALGRVPPRRTDQVVRQVFRYWGLHAIWEKLTRLQEALRKARATYLRNDFSDGRYPPISAGGRGISQGSSLANTVAASICSTSAGRANGSGAGSPGLRGPPIREKKLSRPSSPPGIITQHNSSASSALVLTS